MDRSHRNTPTVIDTVLHLYRVSQRGGVDMFLGFEETNSAMERAISTRLPVGQERGFPLPFETVRRLEGCRHSLALS
jgi:hypothetical protein